MERFSKKTSLLFSKHIDKLIVIGLLLLIFFSYPTLARPSACAASLREW